jgi:site-specific recombinase XerD
MSPQPLSHEMWFAQFEVYLHQQGYRAKTSHRYRTVCRQFLQYLQERGIALEQAEPATLAAYLQAQCQRYEQRHGRAPRHAHHLFNRGITLLLRLVHGAWPPPTLPTNPQARFQQQVCEGYAQWLARCRGLAPRTIAARQARAQKLLVWLGARGTPAHLSDLSVADLDAYLAA